MDSLKELFDYFNVLTKETNTLYYAKIPQKRFEQLQTNLIKYFKFIGSQNVCGDEYVKEKTEKILKTENTPGSFLNLIRMLNVGNRVQFAMMMDKDLRYYVMERYDSLDENNPFRQVTKQLLNR